MARLRRGLLKVPPAKGRLMRAYVGRRLLLMIPSLILVSMIVFGLIRFIPGSVIDQILADMTYQVGERDINQIKEALGLDVPVHVQYVRWLGAIVTRGDLGTSLFTGQPVLSRIADALPISIELGILAIAVSLLIALPVGIYSGIRQDTWGDYVARSFAIICISLPSFWLGTMIMVFPSIWWQWTPPMVYVSFVEDPAGNLRMFIIPSIVMGMFMSGATMRMTRTMMLEVMRQDYIRTAWSKGLRERVIISRHALKNALIPVVTLVGIQVPVLVGGSVVIEQIFNLPGIGRLVLTVLNEEVLSIGV
jgi:peptide/nickel transport system permease protein